MSIAYDDSESRAHACDFFTSSTIFGRTQRFRVPRDRKDVCLLQAQAQRGTMLLAVKSGIGLAPLPLIVGESENDLVRLLGPLSDLNTQFYLLMHQDMMRTPRVRAFFDFIVNEVKSVRAILEGKIPSSKPASTAVDGT